MTAAAGDSGKHGSNGKGAGKSGGNGSGTPPPPPPRRAPGKVPPPAPEAVAAVVDLIAELGIPRGLVLPGSTLASLDMDELDLVQFVLMVEQRVDGPLPDDAVTLQSTVAEVAALMQAISLRQGGG